MSIQFKVSTSIVDIAYGFTDGTYSAGQFARFLGLIDIDRTDSEWRETFSKKSNGNTIETLKRLLEIATAISEDDD